MTLDDPTRAEVRAAVQRNLQIYHRVLAKRQQESEQPRYLDTATSSDATGERTSSRTNPLNRQAVTL